MEITSSLAETGRTKLHPFGSIYLKQIKNGSVSTSIRYGRLNFDFRFVRIGPELMITSTDWFAFDLDFVVSGMIQSCIFEVDSNTNFTP